MLVFCFSRREASLVSPSEKYAVFRAGDAGFFFSKAPSASGQLQREPRSSSSLQMLVFCFWFRCGTHSAAAQRPRLLPPRRRRGKFSPSLIFFSNTSHPPSLPYNKMYFLPDFNRFPTIYISHHFCMTVQAVYFPEKPANLGTIHLGIPENTSHPAYHSLSELHFPCILYGSWPHKRKTKAACPPSV